MQKKKPTKKSTTKSLLVVGKNYFVQTVTLYYTGKLVRIEKNKIILTQVAWIADTGRFAGFMQNGVANEVEPFPADLEIGLQDGAIIAIVPWRHTLPSAQK